MNTETTITADAAAHVLWSEDLGGYPAGSFTAQLLRAWGLADEANAERLAARGAALPHSGDRRSRGCSSRRAPAW